MSSLFKFTINDTKFLLFNSVFQDESLNDTEHKFYARGRETGQ